MVRALRRRRLVTRLLADGDAEETIERSTAEALERIGNALTTRLRRDATDRGLSALQLQILQQLPRLPLGDRTVSRLAQLLQVTQPTVSDAVATLVGKGLVVRVRDRVDGRRSQLQPTAAAITLIGSAEPVSRVAQLLGQFDKTRVTTTLEVLLDLIAEMDAAGIISRSAACTTCRFFIRDRHPDSGTPHHCSLVDQPLSAGDLRVHCPEHEHVAS